MDVNISRALEELHMAVEAMRRATDRVEQARALVDRALCSTPPPRATRDELVRAREYVEANDD
jgi:hypothetical protein